MKKASFDNSVWKSFQDHLGYSDEEMRLFRENPRNEEVLSHAPAMASTTIIAEVVNSHGCNSRHMVGEKLYFDSAGNLVTKLNPKKVCVYAISAIAPLIFASNELVYAGADPNSMRFKRTGCYDVGVKCGGWGHIVLELKVVDRT